MQPNFKVMASAFKPLFKESDKLSVMVASNNKKWKDTAIDVVAVQCPDVYKNKENKENYRREFYTEYVTTTMKVTVDQYALYRRLTTEGRVAELGAALTQEIKDGENRAKTFFNRILNYVKKHIEGEKKKDGDSEGIAKLRESSDKMLKLINKAVEESGLGVETNKLLREAQRIHTLIKIQDFTK